MDICEWCGNEIDPDNDNTASDPETFCGGECENSWHEDNDAS